MTFGFATRLRSICSKTAEARRGLNPKPVILMHPVSFSFFTLDLAPIYCNNSLYITKIQSVPLLSVNNCVARVFVSSQGNCEKRLLTERAKNSPRNTAPRSGDRVVRSACSACCRPSFPPRLLQPLFLPDGSEKCVNSLEIGLIDASLLHLMCV